MSKSGIPPRSFPRSGCIGGGLEAPTHPRPGTFATAMFREMFVGFIFRCFSLDAKRCFNFRCKRRLFAYACPAGPAIAADN